MNKRTKATLTLAALLALPVTVAATADADTNEVCASIPRWADFGGPKASLTLPVDAPYGGTVTVVTRDNYFAIPEHGDRANAATQPSERVTVTAGGTTVTTNDLADGTDVTEVLVFDVGDAFTEVLVVHAPNGVTPNSLFGSVCVTPFGPPAPTTTTTVLEPEAPPVTDTPMEEDPEPVPTTVPVETVPPVVVETPVAAPVVARPAYTG